MRIRARRTLGAVTTVALSAIVIGSLPGGAATAKAQDADSSLAYTCRFPSGSAQTLGVRVQGTFPATGTVGRPVQPGRITATVTIPKAALTEVTALGSKVAGTAGLDTAVTQNGKSTPVTWSGLAAPATPVPADGDLVLAASGTVPPVTPAAGGDLSFTAGDLALTLTGEAGGTGDPQKLPIACSPAEGSAPTLATVPVSAPSGSPAPAAPGAPKPGPKTRAAGIPPECGKYTGPTDDWISGCVYMSGFSNVQKLNGAAVLNDPAFQKPVLTNIAFALTDTGATVRQKFVGPLRSRSTFLTFGFMPTTATMELTQRPLGPGKDYGTFDALDDGSGIQKVSAHMRMSVRILDVKVNGSSLDVGPRCRTRTDADIKIKGEMPSILEAGVLDGAFTIPAFQGCGVGENLDPLFSGTVAGPGNHLRVTLAPSCLPDGGTGCPPVVPEPKRNTAAAPAPAP